ncbi:nuclear transport factor 2 family protein [Sporichthya sp.]|uniref:nuclear transport factor 2 family protein n=1 Tax=Sporichthya sp. TaxID=65475 RepID=UPI0017EB99C1|nr:nuclear transport factor 2 family protein [Sporichthya sp.]MBA3741462.1 nuclear transport factor 2 family protein [Sporichthya sp.]
MTSLVQRYLVDGIMGKDLAVFGQILHPDYAFTSAGGTISGRDGAYVPMVRDYLAKEPTIDVVIHDVVVGDGAVALWVTKRTTAPRTAAWPAILIYLAHEGRLVHCWSEQDWASHRRQVREGVLAPVVLDARTDPWLTTPVAADASTELVAFEWLRAGGWQADDLVLDDGGAISPERPELAFDRLTLSCCFTAGDRFAFHATQHGRYLGGPRGRGAPPGSYASLPAAGIGTVRDGRVVQARVVTDRTAFARSLVSSASS